LAPQGDGPGRAEAEDTPGLTAPPAQVVDVRAPAVDKDAGPARPGVEPPAALTPIAARDEVKLADLAEPTAGDQPLDVAKRGHEMDVLGDHEDSPRGVGGADHPVGLRERRCDRLLHQDVQARLQRHERVGEVPVVGRAHDRSGGTPVARRFLVRAERRRGAKLARQGAGPPAEAAADALLDAELTPGAVQALYYGNVVGSETEHQLHTGPQAASILGIPAIPTTRFEAACASSHAAFRHAVMEIAAGVSDVVLVGGAERVLNVPTPESTEYFAYASDANWEQTLGLTFPGVFALIARAHMQRYGTTEAQMAAVAVKNHKHGTLNPKAQFQKEITLEQVLKSAYV